MHKYLNLFVSIYSFIPITAITDNRNAKQYESAQYKKKYVSVNIGNTAIIIDNSITDIFLFILNKYSINIVDMPKYIIQYAIIIGLFTSPNFNVSINDKPNLPSDISHTPAL